MTSFNHALLCVTFLCMPMMAHANHVTSHVTVYPSRSPLTSPTFLAKEEEMKQVAGAVSLIPAEKFENTYAKTFKDTLARTPGVFAQNRYGEEVRLSIRGSGLSRGFHLRGIELLVDGVPINLADGGGDFQEIDPTNVQYIEVYKGSNALRFGAATLGGAVNVVTPTARNVDYTTLFRMDGGSFGNIRTHVATAQKEKKWDAYAAVTTSHADGYREQSVEDKLRLNTNIGYAFNDKAETRFYLTYNNLNQEVPGSLTRGVALNAPRTAPAGNKINDNARDIRSIRFANTTAFQLSSTAKLEVGAFVNDKELFHPIFQVLDQQSTDYGAFTRVNKTFNAFNLPHRITAGINYHAGKTDALQYINVRGSRGTKTADADQKSQNVSAYGEGQFHVVQDVSAIFGGQVLWASREFVNNVNTASSDKDYYTEFNPKVGVLWDITPASQVFANVSRSSEVPTFSEVVQSVGGPPTPTFIPLDVQTAWTTEIGTRGSHRTIAWDLTAYHSRINNELLQFTTSPIVPAATFNANETVHQGLELGGSWNFAQDVWRNNDMWTLSQIYNFNDFRFVNDAQYGDNQIAGVPRHTLRTGVKYRQERWSVEPYAEVAPEAPFVDFSNTTKATSYAVFNVEGQVKINDHIDFFIEGRNLTGQNYISNVSTVVNASVGPAPAIYFPGDGRSVYAGIKAKF